MPGFLYWYKGVILDESWFQIRLSEILSDLPYVLTIMIHYGYFDVRITFMCQLCIWFILIILVDFGVRLKLNCPRGCFLAD